MVIRFEDVMGYKKEFKNSASFNDSMVLAMSNIKEPLAKMSIELGISYQLEDMSDEILEKKVNSIIEKMFRRFNSAMNYYLSDNAKKEYEDSMKFLEYKFFNDIYKGIYNEIYNLKY